MKRSEGADSQSPSVLEEFREARTQFYKTWWPILLVMALGFGIAWFFVEPAPPSRLVIATGSREGAYFAAADKYARLFAENGIELVVRETAGSVENYELLQKGEVEIAIVQGGTVPDDVATADVESIASLYLEPVWVFTRGQQIHDLRELAGRRIGVGDLNSGTKAIAELLLKKTGLSSQVDEDGTATEFVTIGNRAAATALQSGQIDAAFFVLAPDSALVSELMRDGDIFLMSFDRQLAYVQLFPYVSGVTLAKGVVDLAKGIPEEPIQLIAPAANLVATRDLHDAFVPLFIQAAQDVHGRGGVFTKPGEFPSLRYAEFAPNTAARDYFEQGPSFLQRYVPFWVASLINRTKILLLPLLALAFPLIKAFPPIYRWRIRSRIYKWYSVLREIDQNLREAGRDDLSRYGDLLAGMQCELEQMTVPLSYMEEFYHLQLHLDLVQRRLSDALEGVDGSSG